MIIEARPLISGLIDLFICSSLEFCHFDIYKPEVIPFDLIRRELGQYIALSGTYF